jgi:hypothetical protein
VFGQNAAETLEVVNNFAVLLKRAEKYGEAEKMYERAYMVGGHSEDGSRQY